MAEWIRLAEQKAAVNLAQSAPKSKTERNPKGSGRKGGGIRAASRELGIDRDAARRARKVASLSDAAKSAACRRLPIPEVRGMVASALAFSSQSDPKPTAGLEQLNSPRVARDLGRFLHAESLR